jgi:hypothetical protein
MSKYTFIKQPDPDNWLTEGDAKVTVEFNAIGLDHILEEFTYFLRGAGFFADGHLELVHDEELITTDDDLDNLDQFFGKTREIAKNLDRDSSYNPGYHRPIKSNPQTDDE